MAPQPDRAAPARILELDSIRGLAALGILLTHLPLGFWFGETGVDLFFVLSGYLITTIIINNLHRDDFYRVFFIRRAFRIWPIYYLAISGLFVFGLFRHSPSHYEGSAYYLLYLQNIPRYWGGTTPPFLFSLDHTWTLALEEQFYLLWPVVLLLTGRRSVAPIAVLLIWMPFFLRNVGLDRTVLLAHSEGFGWGALLSLLLCAESVVQAKASRTLTLGMFIIGAVGSAVTYVVFAEHILKATGWGKGVIFNNQCIALINLFYFCLIGGIAISPGSAVTKPLRWAPLVYIGQLSYGLYLYHWILYEEIDTVAKFGLHLGDPYWLDLLKILLSVGMAALSWEFIEQPLLRLRDRFVYREPRLALEMQRV